MNKKTKRPTIADIANNCGKSHYFDRDTLRFFGQTRKSFSIFDTEDPNVFYLVAPMKMGQDGDFVGHSESFWEKQNDGTWKQVKK